MRTETRSTASLCPHQLLWCFCCALTSIIYYIEGCGDVEDTLRTLDRICYFNGFSTKVNSLSPYSTRYFDNANPFMLQLSTPPTPVCAMSMIRLVNLIWAPAGCDAAPCHRRRRGLRCYNGGLKPRRVRHCSPQDRIRWHRSVSTSADRSWCRSLVDGCRDRTARQLSGCRC